MKSIKYSIYILIAVIVTGTACSKSFLEIDPQQNTDASLTIADIGGMRAAVNGIYSSMQSANYYGRTASLLPDLMSDNLFISVVNANRYQPQDQYVTVANDGMTSGLWNSLFIVVANANLLITKGEALTVPNVDTAERRKIIGEAYALRALAYFDLSRFFSQPYNYTADASHFGAPIVLTTGTEKSQVQSPSRSTVKQTYDQIIKDLKAAITNLSTTTAVGSKGRFNLYAAQALLSRVYLYKQDWQNAADMATAVITANKYPFYPIATLVADFKKQASTESILEVAFTTTDNLSTDWLGYFYNQSGYGDAIATDNIYNAYKATDVRKSFLTRSRRTGTGGENPANIVNKYSNVTTFDENIKLIRIAEVYLNRAEAYANLNQEDNARNDVNKVIGRSDTDPTSQLTNATTGPALITAILNERRRELAFEGHRLFDLTRNKISFTKIRRGGATIAVNFPENKAILPIPQRELDANPNIKNQQNQGY